jgi:hypothetical protein
MEDADDQTRGSCKASDLKKAKSGRRYYYKGDRSTTNPKEGACVSLRYWADFNHIDYSRVQASLIFFKYFEFFRNFLIFFDFF